MTSANRNKLVGQIGPGGDAPAASRPASHRVAPPAVLEKLEFDRVREVLASHCHTQPGKKLALSLTPSTKTHVVRRWLDQVRELLAVADTHGFPPLGGVRDIEEYVRATAFPAPLEPEPLARIADTLAATRAVSTYLAEIADAAPTLASLRERIDDLSSIAETIRESIDARGRVADHASEKLASIRRAIEHARRRIRATFDRILRQTHLTRMLQYAGTTFHDDRMVLPLKAEHRGRIPGIIHRSSDTGATLFVEPAESVELNNTIVRLRDEEAKEVDRILRALSKRVQLNAPAILTTLRGLATLDLIAAKARYARKRHGICPHIDEHNVLDLRAARHPVLVELFDRETQEGATPREVVPIDVRLGDDFDVLIVTGPNTGGKTVTLKTVGLMAVMTQCGIPIPAAEGTKLPIYTRIFLDIGDEQSLQQSLSTFSSHLSTLLDMLTHSGSRSLVLIDELGAGTDPDEGAAIGRAIVGELLKRGVRAVVTTHLSALKAVAYTTERVDNAAVQFDPDTLQPTYHLRIGEPGNSNALIIARRLGMPARLIDQARRYLDDSTRALNRAIAGTLRTRRNAEKARRRAQEAELQSRRQRERLEKEAHALETARRAFEQWTEWIARLQPGDPVYVRSLRRTARVVRLALHKQRVVIGGGTMEIELPLRDIEPPGDTPRSS